MTTTAVARDVLANYDHIYEGFEKEVGDEDNPKSYTISNNDSPPTVIMTDSDSCSGSDSGEEHSLNQQEELPFLCVQEEQAIVNFTPIIYEEHNKNGHKVGDVEEWDSNVEQYQFLLLLLESDVYEDNRYGMKRLVKLANSEFVNLKKEGSVALALSCTGQSEFGRRLSSVYLFQLESDDLKMPALKVLVSCLELLRSLDAQCPGEYPIDFNSNFWKRVIGIFASIIDNEDDVDRVTVALTIKCICLLQSIDATIINPLIRYSFLPFILDVYQMAGEERNRILRRDATSILSGIGVTPPQV